VRIALDAMGGDHAPAEPLAAALEAVRTLGVEVALVGREEEIRPKLPSPLPAGLTFVHASEVIGMDESPVAAFRRKRDSSIAVGLRLMKEGQADAFVSAGSTGALMAGGLLTLGRLKGVERPALGTVMPTRRGRGLVMLDIGANMDPSPRNLAQFAVMGSCYAEIALGIERPRVGLLNVGVEEEKGNELTKSADRLLRSLPINYAGFVEARDLPDPPVDVVVCDGFVGNVLVKYTEGLAGSLLGMIKEELLSGLRTRIGALLAKPAFGRVRRRMDYSEYGGAPLLGLSGLVIKCHGSSRMAALRNGIRVARDFAGSGVMEKIATVVATVPASQSPE
jgi:glycerol-3-phosphate acyltransferase PlsX